MLSGDWCPGRVTHVSNVGWYRPDCKHPLEIQAGQARGWAEGAMGRGGGGRRWRRQGGGLSVSMTLRAMPSGEWYPGRATHVRKVEG